MTPEQKHHYDTELLYLRSGGNSGHSAFVADSIGGLGCKVLGPVDPPVVGFSNDDDTYYVQYFQNWAEVREVVDQLLKTAEQAWGKEK